MSPKRYAGSCGSYGQSGRRGATAFQSRSKRSTCGRSWRSNCQARSGRLANSAWSITPSLSSAEAAAGRAWQRPAASRASKAVAAARSLDPPALTAPDHRESDDEALVSRLAALQALQREGPQVERGLASDHELGQVLAHRGRLLEA